MATTPPATMSGVSSRWVTAIVVSVGPYRLKTRTCGAAAHSASTSAAEHASPPRATTDRVVRPSLPTCGLDSSTRR